MTVLDSGVGWIPRLAPPQMSAVWAEVDLLIGTVEELGYWTGCGERRAIAEAALAKGPSRVVVKLGGDGAAYQSADGEFAHQPACPVSRSDVTIGAGDAFNGGLIAALATGAALADAVARGQQIAAKVVDAGRGVLGWGRAARLT